MGRIVRRPGAAAGMADAAADPARTYRLLVVADRLIVTSPTRFTLV